MAYTSPGTIIILIRIQYTLLLYYYTVGKGAYDENIPQPL